MRAAGSRESVASVRWGTREATYIYISIIWTLYIYKGGGGEDSWWQRPAGVEYWLQSGLLIGRRTRKGCTRRRPFISAREQSTLSPASVVGRHQNPFNWWNDGLFPPSRSIPAAATPASRGDPCIPHVVTHPTRGRLRHCSFHVAHAYTCLSWPGPTVRRRTMGARDYPGMEGSKYVCWCVCGGDCACVLCVCGGMCVCVRVIVFELVSVCALAFVWLCTRACEIELHLWQ